MSEITVSEDTTLTPVEKETIIRWSKATNRVEIHTERATIVKWLYAHPEYSEQSRRVGNGAVRSTTGSLPKGCIKLSGTSRKSQQTNQMLGELPEETNA